MRPVDGGVAVEKAVGRTWRVSQTEFRLRATGRGLDREDGDNRIEPGVQDDWLHRRGTGPGQPGIRTCEGSDAGEAVLSGVFADRIAEERSLRGQFYRSSHWTELCLVPTAASSATQRFHLKKGLWGWQD